MCTRWFACVTTALGSIINRSFVLPNITCAHYFATYHCIDGEVILVEEFYDDIDIRTYSELRTWRHIPDHPLLVYGSKQVATNTRIPLVMARRLEDTRDTKRSRTEEAGDEHTYSRGMPVSQQHVRDEEVPDSTSEGEKDRPDTVEYKETAAETVNQEVAETMGTQDAEAVPESSQQVEVPQSDSQEAETQETYCDL